MKKKRKRRKSRRNERRTRNLSYHISGLNPDTRCDDIDVGDGSDGDCGWNGNGNDKATKKKR